MKNQKIRGRTRAFDHLAIPFAVPVNSSSRASDDSKFYGGGDVTDGLHAFHGVLHILFGSITVLGNHQMIPVAGLIAQFKIADAIRFRMPPGCTFHRPRILRKSRSVQIFDELRKMPGQLIRR